MRPLTFTSLRFVALSLAVCAAAPVRADGPFHIPMYTGTPLMIAAGVVTQRNLNRELDRYTPRGNSGTAAKVAPVPAAVPARLAVGSRPAGMPARLASSLPADKRAEAEKLYREVLEKHPGLMQQLGVPATDLASGVATFLAGSYMAYNNIDFPDRLFKPLYEQMRGIIARDARFDQAGPAERREMFEQMAILGTYLALVQQALKQQPNPKITSDMKVAAKGYLEQFMKLDADKLRLTEHGMTLR